MINALHTGSHLIAGRTEPRRSIKAFCFWLNTADKENIFPCFPVAAFGIRNAELISKSSFCVHSLWCHQLLDCRALAICKFSVFCKIICHISEFNFQEPFLRRDSFC